MRLAPEPPLGPDTCPDSSAFSLLDTAGEGEPWEVRKAIDLRLHELGREGFLDGLEADDLAPRLVSEQEVALAMREPPADSPA